MQRWITPYKLGIVLSLLISFWAIQSDDTVNTDGFIHLGSAQLIAEGHWDKAVRISGWPPFYPAVIANMHLLTGLSVEYSAYLVATLAYLIIVTAFLAIIKTLTADQTVLWWALCVVLINPDLNGARVDIYKDAGYWAFYLVAILFFIRFFRYQKLLDAIAWNLAMVVASLFRVEGIIFFAFLPMILWFTSIPWVRRGKLFLLAYVGPMGVLLVLLVFSGLSADFSLHSLGRYGNPLGQIQSLIGTNSPFVVKAENLRQVIGVGEAASYLFLLFAALYLTVVKVFNVLGLLFSVLLGYALYRKMSLIDADNSKLLYGFMLINVLLLMGYAMKWYFLQSRYTMGLALVMMLFVPFIMAEFFRRWRVREKRSYQIVLPLMLLFVVYMFVDSVTKFGASKLYIKEAGRWIQQQCAECDMQRVYLNDDILRYYSGHNVFSHIGPSWEIVRDLVWNQRQNYLMIALRMRRSKQAQVDQLIAHLGPPTQSFQNKIGDQVLIYDFRKQNIMKSIHHE